MTDVDDEPIPPEDDPHTAPDAAVLNLTSPSDVAAPPPAPPRRRLLLRLAQGPFASPLAFTIAFSVHAAAVAAGLYYYNTTKRYQPPELVLPYGWATEYEGTGDPGATPLSPTTPAVTLLPPTVSDPPPAAANDLLSPPPGEVTTQEILSPTTPLDAQQGTADLGPLPGVPSEPAAPVLTVRTPPGVASEDPTAPAPPPAPAATGPASAEAAAAPAQPAEAPAPTPTNSNAPTGTGKAPDGTGQGSGGGAQGVPDGQPSPSTHNQRPDYPEIARRRGWAGTVVLDLDLDADGRVVAVRVAQSSGHGVLDDEAVSKARTWRYTPATLDGRPVPVTVHVPVPYQLQDRRR